ncbi:MAG: peptidase MA family metallohydrolase [Chthoniobacterales bacterium]
MRFLFPSILLFAAVFVRADDDPQLVSMTGLNALPEVEFAKLSQCDLNPLGAKALAIHPEQWKHGETEHFIYHYTRSFVATSVSIEAEFHYRVVAKELEREQPAGDTKSHIYVFDKIEDWVEFQTMGQLEKWTGGIQSGGSLFIKRDPRSRYAGNTLGHEIAHLVLHRYYAEGVPRWLDEGFAQYVSKGARASYQRARGFIAKPHSHSITEDDLIPLKTLLAFTTVPNDRVETFYYESERLVRFLVETDKPTFLTLLDSLGKHQPFEAAFTRIYAGRFANAAVFEERFAEYAAKDSAL